MSLFRTGLITLAAVLFCSAQSLTDLVKYSDGATETSLSTVDNSLTTATPELHPLMLGMLEKQGSSSIVPTTSSVVNLIGEEDNYIVGPGDVLTALVWTTKEEKLLVTVESNGDAVIPTVGVVSLAGKSFSEASETLKASIAKKFRRAQISIFLTTPKTIAVSVYGAVVNPGVYTVKGDQRISEIITMAGGALVSANPREIAVTNNALSENVVDLYQDFRIKKKLSPFVRSGDQVFVPNQEKVITINGAVNYPATYNFIPGESLNKLFELAGGFTRGVDSSRVLITRFINDDDSIVRFELTNELASTFTVQEDDYIFVPEKKDYRVTRQVSITGEVMFPGKYAVREDKTRLIDLIGLAGGLTEEAYLPGSYINRVEFTDAGKAEYERLLTVNGIEMSPDEKSYLKYRNAANAGRVSINFEELMKEEKEIYNIILRGGDEIHVARRGLSVNVMGAVINPGLINYKEGADLSYYIRQAGGYKDDAERRRAKVIKGGTETWLKPRQVTDIEVGDAIWIPERPYRDRLKNAKEILAITGSIFTIVTSTIVVLRYIDDTK